MDDEAASPPGDGDGMMLVIASRSEAEARINSPLHLLLHVYHLV